MNSKDIMFYINGLKSKECQCGQPKRYRMSFCHICFGKLPTHLQRALYKTIRCGYEQAYDQALLHLQGGRE